MDRDIPTEAVLNCFISPMNWPAAGSECPAENAPSARLPSGASWQKVDEPVGRRLAP
jgi:hypothetical protein